MICNWHIHVAAIVKDRGPRQQRRVTAVSAFTRTLEWTGEAHGCDFAEPGYEKGRSLLALPYVPGIFRRPL